MLYTIKVDIILLNYKPNDIKNSANDCIFGAVICCY